MFTPTALSRTSGRFARIVATAVTALSILAVGPAQAQEEETGGGAQAEPDVVREATPVLRVFRLSRVTIDRSLEGLIQTVFRGFGRVAVDRSRNQFAVQCERENLPAIEAFVADLDQASAPPQAGDGGEARGKQIRLIWLVTAAEGTAPPEDLGSVVEELSRVGIDGLKLVSQTIVRAVDQFNVTAFPELGEEPVALVFNGVVGDASPGVSSRITVDISATGSAGSGPVPGPRNRGDSFAKVQATVLVPHDRPTLVCVHPVGSVTSVFVLEVEESP